MNKEEGYEVLIEVVKNNKTHQDYKRVTELADKYFKMVTGKGIETMLQQIITRESEEEFKQRTKITKSVVPAILNSTKLPYQKAARKQPEVREIEFPSESESKELELEEYISRYWGDKSLENFMEYSLIDYNYTDPNAFLITEFDEFNPQVEKAEPYPFIATSTEAVMFEYENEILDYLIVKLPITYMEKGSPQPGYKYTLYAGWDTIVFEQIAEEQKNNPEYEVVKIERKYYSILYFEPKNSKVPAIRFGYLRDVETKGRTFVSVFHSVIAYLEKTLKIDSELDLSTAMTAFPQRFAYVSPCKNLGCNKGQLLDGSGICPDCHGTGKQEFHRGTMDIITLELPRDPAEIIDLERMLVYKMPPIELLTFQQQYIEYLKKSVHAMMFNADLFTRSEVSVTATEKVLETDNMNDTLYPFAQCYSSIWEFVVKDIATYTDMADVKCQYVFPSDFKMKGIQELMSDLKMAKDAGASSSTITAIERDINAILYSDRPEELKKMDVQNELNPFRGNSETDIRFIISQNNVPLSVRTKWENYESIFQELEMEYPDLYEMTTQKINELVNAKTEEYMAIIRAETPEPVVPAFGGQQ